MGFLSLSDNLADETEPLPKLKLYFYFERVQEFSQCFGYFRLKRGDFGLLLT